MNYAGIKELLEKQQKIVIVTHQNPDGDAIGSSLGLSHYLKKKGQKDVTVITPNDYPTFLHWIPGNDEVMVFYHNKKKAPELIMEADIIFCLDFNSLHRINGLMGPVKKSPAIRVLIDHHLEPDIFAKYSLSQPSASSTCELIFDFISNVSGEDDVDDTIAQCLYAGILTDTGGFKHATNPRVYEIMTYFMKLGLDTTRINDRIFNAFTENRLRLFGFALSERLKVFPESHAAVMWLETADKNKFDFQPGDTEGLVNYPLSMSKVLFSVLVTEKDDLVKLSLRSKGDFSAQQIAQKYFNGGGHKNASGGRSDRSVLDTVKLLEEIFTNHKGDLVKAFEAF